MALISGTKDNGLTVKDVVMKDLRPNAPDYENNIRSKFPGYNFIFNFPTCPIKEEQTISFPAYSKTIADTFSPKYEEKKVYGRMDPIPVYQGTTRAIAFVLDMPSNGLAQSREIAKKLNILVRNLYPSYQQDGSVNVISSPPLVRIFFSNIIYDGVTFAPLLGYFTSPIAIKHELADKGVFSRGEGFETYAKSYNISFSFNVLHQYTPGFVNSNGTVSNQLQILRAINS